MLAFGCVQIKAQGMSDLEFFAGCEIPRGLNISACSGIRPCKVSRRDDMCRVPEPFSEQTPWCPELESSEPVSDGECKACYERMDRETPACSVYFPWVSENSSGCADSNSSEGECVADYDKMDSETPACSVHFPWAAQSSESSEDSPESVGECPVDY